MPAEKATALVLRTTDWSESSRIATLWTREFGKVRALAKGGRRLKSNFENALDLLTLCRIVFLRKSSGGLDLLTEAQVIQRFPRLRTDLAALYAAYYVAELLADWTQDYDPHPLLFDEALDTLRTLGDTDKPGAQRRVRAWRDLRWYCCASWGIAPSWITVPAAADRSPRWIWPSVRRPTACCVVVAAADSATVGRYRRQRGERCATWLRPATIGAVPGVRRCGPTCGNCSAST